MKKQYNPDRNWNCSQVALSACIPLEWNSQHIANYQRPDLKWNIDTVVKYIHMKIHTIVQNVQASVPHESCGHKTDEVKADAAERSRCRLSSPVQVSQVLK